MYKAFGYTSSGPVVELVELSEDEYQVKGQLLAERLAAIEGHSAPMGFMDVCQDDFTSVLLSVRYSAVAAIIITDAPPEDADPDGLPERPYAYVVVIDTDAYEDDDLMQERANELVEWLRKQVAKSHED